MEPRVVAEERLTKGQMVNRAVSLRTASVLLSLAAVLTAASPVFAIVSGEPDGDGHPNVGLLAADIPGRGLSPVCSGTLISPTVFLTAAHCTARLEWMGVERVLVTFDRVASRSSSFVSGRTYTSPHFNQRHSDPHDIAVVVLDSPVVGVTPARLPTAGLLDQMALGNRADTTFTPVGYGATGWLPAPGGPAFQADGLRRIGSSSFNALTRAWLKLSQNPATGDSGTCYGDSGGPNFVAGSDVIAAITITGDAVCRATNVTYRLDTPYARWFLSGFVALP
jgi:trypsin